MYYSTRDAGLPPAPVRGILSRHRCRTADPRYTTLPSWSRNTPYIVTIVCPGRRRRWSRDRVLDREWRWVSPSGRSLLARWIILNPHTPSEYSSSACLAAWQVWEQSQRQGHGTGQSACETSDGKHNLIEFGWQETTKTTATGGYRGTSLQSIVCTTIR